MKNLLIPLDGSKQSETVLPIALMIAAKCDCQPILLAVWETGAEETPEAATPRVAELTERGMEYLPSLPARAGAAGRPDGSDGDA